MAPRLVHVMMKYGTKMSGVSFMSKSGEPGRDSLRHRA